MASKLNLSVLALLSMISPAIAADVPLVSTGINGVWSTSDGCQRLKLSKINPDALWKKGFEDIAYLNGRGIEGYEWSCTFLKGFKGTDGEDVYLSNCELEGEVWTDILKVKDLGKEGWVVTVLDSDNNTNAIAFDTMCKGVR